MELILESSGTYLWLRYRIRVKIRLRCCQHGQDSWKQAHWDWIWIAFFSSYMNLISNPFSQVLRWNIWSWLRLPISQHLENWIFALISVLGNRTLVLEHTAWLSELASTLIIFQLRKKFVYTILLPSEEGQTTATWSTFLTLNHPASVRGSHSRWG